MLFSEAEQINIVQSDQPEIILSQAEYDLWEMNLLGIPEDLPQAQVLEMFSGAYDLGRYLQARGAQYTSLDLYHQGNSVGSMHYQLDAFDTGLEEHSYDLIVMRGVPMYETVAHNNSRPRRQELVDLLIECDRLLSMNNGSRIGIVYIGEQAGLDLLADVCTVELAPLMNTMRVEVQSYKSLQTDEAGFILPGKFNLSYSLNLQRCTQ